MSQRPRGLLISDQISDRVRHLHPDLKRRVWGALDALLMGRLAGKPLHDPLAEYQSVRVGRFRVVYRLQPEVVDVLVVGHRRTVYAEAEGLLRKSNEEER